MSLSPVRTFSSSVSCRMIPRRCMSAFATTSRRQKLRCHLVLDFEATCGDSIADGKSEIIEFPTLVYNLERNEVEKTFHEYVRPDAYVNPVLTPFCTELTGITQDVVDRADLFPGVWTRFQEFMQSNEFLDNPSLCAFLTCGNWDLQTMLPGQLALSGLDVSGALVPPYNRWINIKKSYKKHYGSRIAGMKDMLKKLGLELEGRHHSGIDDCRNIAKIVRKMRADGWQPANDLPWPQ